jgi:hypothetical protein
VFYPSGGGESFSEEKQAEFFEAVRRLRIPRGVNVVFFSPFDVPYKKKAGEVTEYTPAFEAHTGLFSATIDPEGQAVFTPKPAVKAIFSP